MEGPERVEPGYLVGSTTGYEDIASVSKGSSDQDVKVVFDKPFLRLEVALQPALPGEPDRHPGAVQRGVQGQGAALVRTVQGVELDETAGTVTIVPDENWWGDKPKLDQVIFRSLDGNADVDAYLNKEIDSVLTTTSERFDRVKDAKDSKVYASTSAQYTHVDFSSKGILKDKQLRLAIQHAVNREALAQVIGGTLPYKLGTLDNHIFLSTDDGYEANTDPNGTFDVEKAKKILDDDGWKTDGQYRKKDGKTLSLSITIPSGATSSQKLSEVMQQQLKDVGIELKLKSVAVDDFFEQYVTPGNYDMTIFVWGGTGFHSGGASIYKPATPARTTAASATTRSTTRREGHRRAGHRQGERDLEPGRQAGLGDRPLDADHREAGPRRAEPEARQLRRVRGRAEHRLDQGRVHEVAARHQDGPGRRTRPGPFPVLL